MMQQMSYPSPTVSPVSFKYNTSNNLISMETFSLPNVKMSAQTYQQPPIHQRPPPYYCTENTFFQCPCRQTWIPEPQCVEPCPCRQTWIPEPQCVEPIQFTRIQPMSNETIPSCTLATYYPHKIFVGSLARTTTPGDLAAFFRQFGVVIEAKVVVDGKGNSKGYGFVSFASPDVVKKVLTSGAIYLNSKRIAVASAIRKKHFDDDDN